MIRLDGWWAYEWNGHLFRVRAGQPEFTKVGASGDFRPMWDYDGPPMDEEIQRALLNLAQHPA